ncbi:integral membrane protein [Neisseria gonorrhoeae]|nr:integral membrane protein [Neisseria gonorrhoeae]SBN00734.1 integral membrane protein [Neisseria gonorrhoeae]SBO55631.1 integral membrane protein [Neisseria gonorrhoeae]SBO57387.1 integral membrane protein [Neisseria gonorrhoeae]
MWHIVAIGYLFVAVMYSAAQPSIARFDLFGFLGGSAHRVHGLRRNRPPPQPPDGAAGTGRIRTAARTTAKRQRHKTLNPFSDGILSAIIRQFSISETHYF